MTEIQEGIGKRKKGVLRLVGAHFSQLVKHKSVAYLHTTLDEFELFFGSVLLAAGLLGFESDKYCDGNTADYLSCTRPSTFYFYDAIDITLVVLGVFFIFFWILGRKK